MARSVFLKLFVVLVTPLVVAAACAGTPPPVPAPLGKSGAGPAPAPQPSTALSAHTPTPPRPPPPVVIAPMAGEPPPAALAEARLIESSCEDLERAARRQAEARIEQMNREVDAAYQNWRERQPHCRAVYRGRQNISGAGGARVAASASSGSGALGGVSGRAATSASRTNNQVAGVDEADLVKNDGRYVYLAVNGALRIVEALEPRAVSVTRLPGRAQELFVHGNRAVVYVAHGGSGRPRCTYGYDCQFAGDGSATRILIFDVSDRSAPRVVREIGLSGSLMAARRIGSAVHTVVSDGGSDRPVYSTRPDRLETCGPAARTARAAFARLKQENVKKILADISLPVISDLGGERTLCDNALRTRIGDGGAYTTIASFDVTDDRELARTATLQSRPGAIFASEDALYLSVVHRRAPKLRQSWYSFYDSVDEVSDIHKFRIGERPADTRYTGSGVVPGHVLNQFSMDEYYGYLRIATTRGRVPDPNVASVVSILAQGDGGNLVRVGAVDGIAPGEDIRSVRFDGDRGYVVTFKKTDPLFVLDLYHPARPAILGELEIPGFSTYMHRIDPDHLLSIGFDANDQGNFAYFDGVILQLFDVREPTDPKLLHKEKIGTRGSSSEAATNHLAFNYFAERGLLAIPMTVCEGGRRGSFGGSLAWSGLLVYRVDVGEGFARLGGIDHGTSGANCFAWWSRANSAVKRSIFLDDLVYSIATDRLKVQRMGHFGEDVADLALMP